LTRTPAKIIIEIDFVIFLIGSLFTLGVDCAYAANGLV